MAALMMIRRYIKWIGYPLFALFMFFISVYLTFPYDRLKEKIEQHVAASGDMEVTIGEIGPSPLLGISAKDVLLVMKPKGWRSRPRQITPKSVDGKDQEDTGPRSTRIILEKVSVHAGLLALLSGSTDVSFDVNGFGGHLEGQYSTEKKEGWSLSLEADELDLSQVPKLKELVGLPMAGKLSAEIEIEVPEHAMNKAAGSMSIDCLDCSVGDGEAKLKVAGNPVLAMGITLPRLRLGRLGGNIKVEQGQATLQNLSAKSQDIEVSLEGSFTLQNQMSYSQANAYLLFKLSPELKKRDAKFEMLENGLASGKRPDGFVGARIMGSFMNLRFMPSKMGLPKPREPRPGRPARTAPPTRGTS